MRQPDLFHDGWSLDNGEVLNRAHPDSFEIPNAAVREILQPGDWAKLIFRINVDDAETPAAVERMWVLVTQRLPAGYLGVLDNEPRSIQPNDDFWLGAELPFEPRHIIDVQGGDDDSVARSALPARIPWNRD
jgi:hypothetical protein